LWYNVLVRKGKGNLPEMLGGNKMFNETQMDSIYNVYNAMVEAEINTTGCVSFSEIQQKVAEMFNCDVDDIF
jgi:hypothetical protein